LDETTIATLKIDGVEIPASKHQELKTIFKDKGILLKAYHEKSDISKVIRGLKELRKITLRQLQAVESITLSEDNLAQAISGRLWTYLDYVPRPIQTTADGGSCVEPGVSNEPFLLKLARSNRQLISAIDKELDEIEIYRQRKLALANRQSARGRNAHEAVDEFINHFIQFYRQCGGKPSANFQGNVASGNTRERGGAFVSFMLALNAMLPLEIRIKEKTLIDRISDALNR